MDQGKIVFLIEPALGQWLNVIYVKLTRVNGQIDNLVADKAPARTAGQETLLESSTLLSAKRSKKLRMPGHHPILSLVYYSPIS